MLKQKAFAAGLWSSIDIGVRSLIQFVVSIVLARLLSPTDFGIYALTLVFAALANILVDGGFSTALIQRRQVTHQEQTAVFWYNMLVAFLLGLVVIMIAPIVARSLGYPVLKPLLYLSAALIPLGALASVPSAMLQRDFRFDLMAKIGLVSSISGGIVAIVAAANGAGIWTFGYQGATLTIINTGLIWIFGSWRPSSRSRLRDASKLFRFGSLVALSGFIEVIYARGYALIIAKLFGAYDLGIYNRGQSLQDLPANILTAVVTRVTFPIFSARSDDKDALRKGARFAQGVAMLFNLPIMGALVAMPDLIIGVIYGPSWLPSAPILAVLAIGGALLPLHAVNLQLLLSQGRSDLYLKAEIVKKIVGISFICLGSLFGILGLAIAQALFLYVAFFINSFISGRMTGYGPLSQLRDLGGTFLLALVMAVVLIIVRPTLTFGDDINLIVLTLLGGGLYLSAALIFRVGATYELLALIPFRRALTPLGNRSRSDD